MKAVLQREYDAKTYGPACVKESGLAGVVDVELGATAPIYSTGDVKIDITAKECGGARMPGHWLSYDMSPEDAITFGEMLAAIGRNAITRRAEPFR